MVTPAQGPAQDPAQDPSGGSTRITELDALRGVAVIGIVLMNVYAFALPAQGYYNPMVWGPGLGEGSQIDRTIWAVSFVFVEDKFRTVFAMLFGAGCLIVLEREKERAPDRQPIRQGLKLWRAHYARMAVLFVIGALHAVLFASNDVLRAYALAACALPLMASLTARALFAICVGLVVVHLAGGLNLLGAAVTDFYEGRTGSDAYLYAEGRFGADPGSVQFMLDQGGEDWGARIARRLAQFPSHLWTLAGSLPINLSAMALGMGLWKSRMLAGEWRLFLLQRLAAISALGAIPALFALAWWVADSDFAGPVVGLSGLVLSAPFDTLLSLAYAALVMAFCRSGGPLEERLAAVGRLSLSNYLLTSVILSAIFASWGMGLFGHVSRGEALALGLVPIAGMLVWSPLWLSRFGQGPAERLWRIAARLLA